MKGRSALGSPQLIAPPTLRPPARRRTGISGSSVLRLTSLAARRGPAKRRRSPPFCTQSCSSSASPSRERRHVGQHDDVGIGEEDVGQRAVDEVGIGRQRLFDVVDRATGVRAPSRSSAPAISATSRRRRPSSVRPRRRRSGRRTVRTASMRLRSSGGRSRASAPPRSGRPRRRRCRRRARAATPAGSRPWASTVTPPLRPCGSGWR